MLHARSGRANRIIKTYLPYYSYLYQKEDKEK